MNEQPTNRLRALRIIVATMAVGTLTFGGVAVALVATGSVPPNGEFAPVLLIALGLLGLGEVIAYLMLRRAMIGKLRRSCEERSSDMERTTALSSGFVTLTVIAGAMSEGLGLFGIVIYLVSGHTLGLLAPCVAIFLLILLFPSDEKTRQFESSVTRQAV